MGEVVKTVGRVATGVFTGGLSELVGGMSQKSTPGPQNVTKPEQVNEAKTEEQAAAEERRRRQLIARQNRTIQTSPLGATINQQLLGGTNLTGQ